MSDPIPGQPGRFKDYIVKDGTMVHKRWLNPDLTRKSGIELEKEQLRVDLEEMASRILEFTRRI